MLDLMYRTSTNTGFLSFLSFIENYGTHIVTSATIGGRDVIYVRQHQSSSLSASDIENYVKDIGDDRFHDGKNISGPGPLKYKEKVCLRNAFFPLLFTKHTIFFYL